MVRPPSQCIFCFTLYDAILIFLLKMDNFSLQIGCKEIVSYLQEGKQRKGSYGQNCWGGCKAPRCLWKWDTKGCPGCPEVTPTPLSKFGTQRRLEAEKYEKAQLMAAPAGSDYSDNDQGL